MVALGWFSFNFQWNNDVPEKLSPCLLSLTEAPAGVWIRGKFKLKIERFVKAPWQEYKIVAQS